MNYHEYLNYILCTCVATDNFHVLYILLLLYLIPYHMDTWCINILQYAAYVGVVGRKKPETVFGAFWMATALGASAVFFISSFEGVMEAVIVLLVMLVLSYTCYLTAELL